MKYKLIIQKHEDNENFAVEMAKFEENNRFNHRMDRLDDSVPLKTKISDALIVELSEDQFKKMKAEVFKTFE